MKVIARKYVQYSIVYFRAINLSTKCLWYMCLAGKEIDFFLCLSPLINVNGFFKYLVCIKILIFLK